MTVPAFRGISVYFRSPGLLVTLHPMPSVSMETLTIVQLRAKKIPQLPCGFETVFTCLSILHIKNKIKMVFF